MPRERKKTAAELTYTRKDLPKSRDLPGGGRQINAIDAGQIVGHLTSRGEKFGEELSLGFVSPSHQRRGVATTMVNLMQHELGYTPVNDSLLTPKAKKWTSKIGLAENPKGTRGYEWAEGQEYSASIGIQDKQASMLQAQQFDPETVRQRAYYKTPRAKKQAQPEQLNFGI